MFKNALVIFLIGITAVSFYSCSQSPSSIGAEILNPDFIVIHNLNSYQDSVAQHSSYFQKAAALGGSSTLLLGKKGNVESSVLVRFYIYLPDSIITAVKNNEVSVTSNSIEMAKTYTYGDSTDNLNFTVHKINGYWSETTFTGDSLSTLSYDQSNIGTAPSFTDSLTTFSIDNQTVFSWLQGIADSNSASNNGLLLQPTQDSKKVLGYQAYLSGVYYGTKLQLVIQKSGVYSDTLIFYPDKDASAATGTLPALSSGDIAVQGGLVVNSKLWFDVSSIPQNAIINSAMLTLSKDSTYYLTGSSYYNSIAVYQMADSTNPDTLGSASTTLNGITGGFSGDISSIVQRWVRTQDNQGMLLTVNGQLAGFELFALRGSNYSNAALRPRLVINYTTKK